MSYINLLDNSAIMTILKSDGLALRHISKDVLTREMVITATTQNIEARFFMSGFNDDKEVRLHLLNYTEAIDKNCDHSPKMSQLLLDDRDIAIASIKLCPRYFRHTRFINEREMAMLAVSLDCDALNYATKSLRDCDKELILRSCEYNINSSRHLCDNFKSSKDLMTALIRQNPQIVSHHGFENVKNLFDPQLEEDAKLMLYIVDSDPKLLRYLNYNKMPELASRAFSKDGMQLKYCSNLVDGYKLSLIAVEQNALAFEYVSDELKNNKEFMLSAFSIISRLKNGFINDFVLSHMSNKLKKDDVFLKHIVCRYLNIVGAKNITCTYNDTTK